MKMNSKQEDLIAKIIVFLSISAMTIMLALSCSGCASVQSAYIAADRATYNAVAPEYRNYVIKDQSISELERSIRIDTLAKWDYRLFIAEGMDPDERYGSSISE